MQTNNENAVRTAAAKLESLKQSILSGDSKLTSIDLSKARSELEFAELREEAKKHREAKADEEKRRAKLLDLQKQLAVVSDSRKSVDAKFTAFEKSLADYLAAATNYQNSLDAVRNSLRSNGLHPGEQIAIINGVAPGQTFFGIQITDIRRKLEIGEVSAENVLPEQEIKPLVESALGEYNRNF
jgi:predicted  nucleic acid-binding Zn-ribbon protein